MDDVFEDIIYQRDIKWAIQNKFLCNINCLRVNIGYDLSQMARRMGDFAVGELEEAINTDVLNKAIAEAYTKYAKGQTLIFATSVKHAQDIAKEIPGAVAVTADTKNRSELIEKFTNREIPVLINCMLFTEGTDIPLIETVMIARPTSNTSLYTQMVGRGLRLHPSKEKLTLIDLVGATGKNNICTAPSLIGVDLTQIPKNKQNEIEGDLFDLPELIIKKADCPESWIKNIEIVDIWAKEQEYNLHNVNWFKMPNGDMVCTLKGSRLIIPAQNELGQTIFNNEKITMQQAFDKAYKYLLENYTEQKYIWDKTVVKKWGKTSASEKQKELINKRLRSFDTSELTKAEAMQILNRIFYKEA